MRRALFAVPALALAGCSPKPAPSKRGPEPSAIAPASSSGDPFCRVLAGYIEAADGDFVSLRTGEPSRLMPSWEASAALPGASTCRVAGPDPVSLGSVFCVLAESPDTAALEARYAGAVATVAACLDGWKRDTGEQLGGRYSEFLPPSQRSATRTLQVHVRLTEALEGVRGSVTLDVALKRPGA